MRRARPDLYFDRVPSLPATDDGSVRPFAENPGADSGDGEDVTWDAATEPRAEAAGSGSDATRTVFRAVDAYGNQRRYGSGQVTLTLSGPATLVGDNPFAFGQYGGLGAVWIRSQPGQPGAITLTASHPLLGQAEIQVRSERAKMANELL